jgi:hypothetical protein
MIKLISVTLVLAFILITGCETDCMTGEDYKIKVSVVENQDIQQNLGFSNHHNVTLNISNIGDTLAKSVTVKSYYCNEERLGQKTCENRTINVGDILPKSTVSKFFEYDRVLIQNQMDGTYHLQYNVTSCLPITTIDNKVFISQR